LGPWFGGNKPVRIVKRAKVSVSEKPLNIPQFAVYVVARCFTSYNLGVPEGFFEKISGRGLYLFISEIQFPGGVVGRGGLLYVGSPPQPQQIPRLEFEAPVSERKLANLKAVIDTAFSNAWRTPGSIVLWGQLPTRYIGSMFPDPAQCPDRPWLKDRGEPCPGWALLEKHFTARDPGDVLTAGGEEIDIDALKPREKEGPEKPNIVAERGWMLYTQHDQNTTSIVYATTLQALRTRKAVETLKIEISRLEGS